MKNSKGTSLLEFILVFPIFMALVFFIISGSLFLSERFLFKYAVYVETRKLLPKESIGALDKEGIKESILRMVSMLPMDKKVTSLAFVDKKDAVEVSVSIKLSFLKFKETCVLKK